ncbi:MAG: hypothetical protein FHP92_01815 [Denitromonas halophila]|nr:MAG: hypothetical protein FHP92_01815 [Denitromonas halophila]
MDQAIDVHANCLPTASGRATQWSDELRVGGAWSIKLAPILNPAPRTESTRRMLMTHIASLAAFRRHAAALARVMIIFVTLFYGWTNYANIVSASHEPAAWLTHADSQTLLVTADDHAHAHDHDDLLMVEHDGGAHQHGHNALDHSHDKQNLPYRGEHLTLDSATHWERTPQASVPPGPSFPFERPPRVIPVV